MTQKDPTTKAAMTADGRSRRCGSCPLKGCSPLTFKVCTTAFVEGFRKGAAWQQKKHRTSKQK